MAEKMAFIRNIFKNRKYIYIKDLIIELTKKEIKVRYKNSFLGYIWSILSPLSLAFVFFIAFKIVMRIRIENYTLFLISGLFPWQWFSNSLNMSVYAFLNNDTLIKKVIFPRSALVYAMVLNDLIHFIISIPVIIFFLILYKKSPFLSWIYILPLLVAIQFIMTSGFSLIVSSLNLFFRDLERLITIFTNLLFYFTPVIYSVDMVPEKYKVFIYLNPLAPLINAYRSMFLKGYVFFNDIIFSLIWAFIFFFIGYAVYKKLEWRFAEIL